MARYDALRKLERNRLIQEYRKTHPELSFREIGEVFGISESRAWRIVYGNKKKERNKKNQGGKSNNYVDSKTKIL
jgi:DNA-directed RNA polymerase specialized sigma subunit